MRRLGVVIDEVAPPAHGETHGPAQGQGKIVYGAIFTFYVKIFSKTLTIIINYRLH